MASKIQASIREQAKEVIQLIDMKSLASTQLPPGVGEHLNIKA